MTMYSFKKVFRIYADGTEFGIDYPSLEAAIKAKLAYAGCFPSVKYVIHAIRIAA